MLEDTTVNSIDGNLFRSLFHYASWRRQVSFFFFFFAMAIPNAIYPFAFFSLNHTINYLIYRWWAFTLTKFNGYLIPESIQIIVYARNKKEICVCELKRLPTTTKKEWLIFFFILNEKVEYELSNKESSILFFLSKSQAIYMWKHFVVYFVTLLGKKWFREKCVYLIN